ncbi:acid phosphatase [Paenibacillus jiagnxiensis]|uniref:acid phosphatase n=1 Tax=Paenibacillus jiagnxiensis TaxID=3228926 RepID=UPI0033B80373
MSGGYVGAAALPTTVEPSEAAWGYFVDHYKNNTKENSSPTSNPAIGVLSEFLKLWTPGSTWGNGKKLNSTLLDANIQKVEKMTTNRTPEEEKAAYLDDRRNQSYSVMDGLGSLTDVYRKLAGATTTLHDVPADATMKKYDDEGNNSGDPESALGSIVTLVNTLRGSYSSTNPSKSYFSYPRPFRWRDKVQVLPTLIPAKNPDPTNDGGYPSGHTNAAYLTAFAMAYAVPERYQELLTRASELGNNRIVTGMHSPFDVMGGRVMGTALAAAILNDPDNSEIKKAAFDEAHSILLTQTGNAADRFNNDDKNKKEFTERLTYGFPQTGVTTEPVKVPKGAEVLLETRQPYLDSEQRRWVLATTGLASGYPVLDDAEGWGRLNLFAAADGYGAFVNDVTVNMDASKGGFNAEDSWRNDISGTGKLTKEGTGTLMLEGRNTFSGGTQIDEGTIKAKSASALGSGNVTVNDGTLVKSVAGMLMIGRNYKQSENGTLELYLARKSDVLEIKGMAAYDGTLRLNFANNYVPKGKVTIIRSGGNSGEFDSIETFGLSDKYKVNVIYTGRTVQIDITTK